MAFSDKFAAAPTLCVAAHNAGNCTVIGTPLSKSTKVTDKFGNSVNHIELGADIVN